MHAAIGSFIWNKWTPAAVATGTEGILTADYVTVDWNKVDYLGTVGLYPWYTLPTAHRTVRSSSKQSDPFSSSSWHHVAVTDLLLLQCWVLKVMMWRMLCVHAVTV